MNGNKNEPAYRYFNIDILRDILDIKGKTLRKGRELYEAGLVSIKDVYTGYERLSGEMSAEVMADGFSENKSRSFPMRIVFSKRRVLRTECLCEECLKDQYFSYYKSDTKCAYMAALLEETERFLDENTNIDATDYAGSRFLRHFRDIRKKDRLSRQTDNEKELVSQSEGIELEPRLTCNNGNLELGFRIGSKKKFMIRNFSDFCDHVKNAETAVYGSKTQISHDPDDFTDESRPWLEFIQKIVQDDQRQFERMRELNNYGYMKKPKQSVLPLFGWRLDQFWQLMQGKLVEYENKDDPVKNRHLLKCSSGKPEINLYIERADELETGIFEGINVSAEIPENWEGMENLYIVDKEQLLKVDDHYSSELKKITGQARYGLIDFTIGRNKLSEFYHDVLPEMEKLFNVVEKDHETIAGFIAPDAEFSFYLDYDGDAVSCRSFVSYGEDEYPISDLMSDDAEYQSIRRKDKESEVINVIFKYYPFFDPNEDEFFCNEDEEVMYRAMVDGPAELEKYGNVLTTARFSSSGAGRKMNLAVGISVEGSLLNLQISSDEVSREELRNILEEYKPNKKYYRLKNGEFVDMQSQALLMLRELMQTLNLPAKDILREKVDIPAYRTLYLDALLDEKQGVYANRDKSFRQLVRNFRTIGDAEFDEPESLSGIMRAYQKDGFKWIRTLGQYGFGGILADDMGLGKTLQAIAVLLSHKEENSSTEEAANRNPSLIVAPASLVYNWMEELKNFAPQLKAVAVAGGQAERRSVIDGWQDWDVMVTSYDLLKRDIGSYEGKRFFYEIIDEAQYIKNHNTAAAKAVKIIESDKRLALTGTPIENRLSELWSIFDFLMPGFLYKYEEFRKKFEVQIVKLADGQAMQRLQTMVSPFIMRRLKNDVLSDLPDKLEENRIVQFGEKQQKLYDAQVVRMQDIINGQSSDDFNKNRIQILAELTRLRQICCDPGLCFENYDGGSAKLESFIDLVESAIDGEHRILVFSQFTTMLDIIQKELDRKGIEYYVITGATPKEQRLGLVHSFNTGKVPVFLISLKAGGTGLNLTGADIVIHYDPWWNVAAQNQATDRAHRIGQTKKVTVYRMIVRDSIEERIQKLQETKQNLADSIVGAADGASLGQMSQEDMLDLLR